MIRAGNLREKITFESTTRASDGAGGGGFTPQEKLSTFAEVKELKSDPDLLASQEQVKQVIQFRIRYRTDVIINNGDVLKWRGFNYTVNNFVVDAMRTEILMYCTQDMNTTKRTSEEPTPPAANIFDNTFDNTFN